MRWILIDFPSSAAVMRAIHLESILSLDVFGSVLYILRILLMDVWTTTNGHWNEVHVRGEVTTTSKSWSYVGE